MARRRPRRPRRSRLRLPRPLLALAALAFAILLATNYAVRSLGGDVSLLASRRLGDRALALGYLAAHTVRGEGCAQDVAAALREAAARHGVSARLVLAVAEVESSLVHTRISGTGAMGLMQLMPDTARALGVRDPFDVRDNADGGVRLLKELLAMYRGNVRRAVAAYNAGPARVPMVGALRALPGETREYVARIAARL